MSQNKVKKSVVTDYQQWVAPEDEMWLDKIIRKCNAAEYVSSAEFREDFQKIVNNCQAYNTEGHGSLASPGAAFVLFIIVKQNRIITHFQSDD